MSSLVRSGDVVRCDRVPEAKLVPQPTNRDSMSVQITHELGVGSPPSSPRQPLTAPPALRASTHLHAVPRWAHLADGHRLEHEPRAITHPLQRAGEAEGTGVD